MVRLMFLFDYFHNLLDSRVHQKIVATSGRC